MILILCPECAFALGVRLNAHRESAASCRACRTPLDYGYLIRSGLPSGLIARLMEWGARSTDILTDHGTGLDDPQFVIAWKELRDFTRSLLQAWRRFLETDADDRTDVFDRAATEGWSDDSIAEWRRQQRRLGDLSWYGFLIGSRSDVTDEVVPYPTGAASDEDREAFRSGFRIAVEFIARRDSSAPFGEELAELASKYGRPCST
jgi:hypothetical protein